jgi:hypothetical protein
MYFGTALNRSVNASPPSAARATQNASRGFAPLWHFAPPHFFAPVKTLRVFPYRAQKNVVYRRNVKRKFWKYIKNNILGGNNYNKLLTNIII